MLPLRHLALAPRTCKVPISSAVAAVMVSTARSNASALCGAGLRKPDTLRTYCNAAAWKSSSVASSWKGGRNVLMDLHMRPIILRMQPVGLTNPMAESAKGWHNIQLAVMGFIGLCGVLRMGNEPDGPAWLGMWSAGMVILAFVSSLLSMWMVGSVAFPLYNFGGESQMPAGAPQRLRGGIRMTFVSILLMVLGGLAGWWPSGVGGDKVEVRDANGTSRCGTWVDGAPAGSIWLRTSDGTVITINLRAVAEMNQVGAC